jgi:hypothetical protein
MKIVAYKDRRFHIPPSAYYKDWTTNYWGWSMKQEGTGRWRKQHTEKHCQIELRWSKEVDDMGSSSNTNNKDNKSISNLLESQVERQKFLRGIHRYDTCALTLKGTRYEFYCSHLARIEFSHRLLKTWQWNFSSHKKEANLFTSWVTVSFTRRTLLHEVSQLYM